MSALKKITSRPAVSLCLCGLSAAWAAETGTADTQPAPIAAGPPQLSSADQTYVIQLIRQTLSTLADGERPAPPRDVPESVAQVKCPVAVTLRIDGSPIGIGQSDGRYNVAQSCWIANIEALKMARGGNQLTESSLKRLGIEVELLGSPQPLPYGLADKEQLARQYQPGLDGIAIRLDDHDALIRPSQIVASGLSTTEAIALVESQLDLPEEELQQKRSRAVCLRFPTLHLWQPRPEAPVVALRRGCALVKEQDITAKYLDRALFEIARYLQDRQGKDGLFPKAYLPWSDRSEGSAPAMIQAGAAWSLATYAALSDDAQAMAAAVRTVDALSKNLVPLNPSTGDASTSALTPAYLAAPREGQRLGATAVLLLAACDIQPERTFRSLRERLAEAILSCQLPTGMMRTNFATTRAAAPQETDPGQAVLALTSYHLRGSSPASLSAIDNAFGHYRKQFAVKPSIAIVPWLARAYAQIARPTGKRDYAEFTFELVDYVAERQLTPDTCPWPLMQGGIDPLGRGLAGITTAVHMSAVADALALARHLKDADRATRYEQILRSATRFVLQLQFRLEECYYVPSPFNTVNGVRTAPWDHTLAIENSQLALVALVKARQLLFPKPK